MALAPRPTLLTVAAGAVAIVLLLVSPTGLGQPLTSLARPPGPAGRVTGGAVPPRTVNLTSGWTNITTRIGEAPPPRAGAMMAFDPAMNATVLFGGNTPQVSLTLNDTWELANGSWVNITSSVGTPPSARWGAGFVYDPSYAGLVLFGGRNTAGSIYNDTWVLNASGWTELNTTVAPSPRTPYGSMVYDPSDGYVLLFGGNYLNSYRLNDTWTFRAGVWTNITSTLATAPPLAEFFGAYDPIAGDVVFYGGSTWTTGGYAETWTFSGGAWTNATATSGTAPSATQGSQAFAYDPNFDGSVLFSGLDNFYAATTGTWLYSNGTWSDLTASAGTPPTGVWEGSLALDPNLGSAVLFGGLLAPGLAVSFNSTWLLSSYLNVRATSNVTAGTVPFSVQFNATVAGAGAPFSYNWSFGDGTPDSTVANPTHPFTAAATYHVTVNVTNSTGQSGTAGIVIVAYPALPPPYPSDGEWQNRTAALSNAPPARAAAMMAYDPAMNATVLFGGDSPTLGTLNDTWALVNGTWLDLSGTLGANAPVPRWGSGFVYDPVYHGIVLFGGRDAAGSIYDDTWVFNASGWTQLDPSNAPSDRTPYTSMVYDAADGYILLFGGNYLNSYRLNDTWTFTNDTWTDLSANLTTAPPPYGFFGTYDPVDRDCVFYGGAAWYGGGLGETWTFAGGAWTNRTSTSGPVPTSTQGSQALTFDPVEGGVLMFTGQNNTYVSNNETWVYTGGMWRNLTAYAGVPPAGVWEASLAYDPEYGGDVFLGGSPSNPYMTYSTNQTWVFQDTLAVAANATPTSSVALYPVTFSSELYGGGAPLRYNWSFGDGSPNATTANITHSYASGGEYVVELNVTNATGASAAAQLEVQVYPSISVVGTVGHLPADVGVPVAFNATGSGGAPPAAYHWSFGDGAGSLVQNTTHRYVRAGNYTWAVWRNDSEGHSEEYTGQLTIWPVLGVAATSSSHGGEGPLNVAFNSTVTGGYPPYVVDWSFGDGSPNSTETNVSHAYAQVGTYTARLLVRDAGGGYFSENFTVAVVSPLQAGATVTPASGLAPLTVTYASAPTGGRGPFRYLWNFGTPGATSPLSGGVYTYAKTGSYTVNLTLTDSLGDAANATFPVVVDAPLSASLLLSTARGFYPLPVELSAVPVGGSAPYGFAWSFGDGSMSTQGPYVNHTYAHAGTFDVSVNVTAALGTVVHRTASVEVGATPTISLTGPSVPIPNGSILTLKANVTGGFPSWRFAWTDLPLGCPSVNTATLQCVPTETGTFLVRLNATDSAGDELRANLTVEITAPTSSVVPPTSSSSSELGLEIGLAIVAALVVGIGLYVWSRRRGASGSKSPSAETVPGSAEEPSAAASEPGGPGDPDVDEPDE